MSRKFIISEDERARILGLHETAKSNHGTVISEQSMGVGFMSGEPNGLKIKKDEPTEQVTRRPQAPKKSNDIVVTPQMMGVTPAVKKAMDVLNAKVLQGDETPSAVVPEDPKAIYLANVGTSPAGDKYVEYLFRWIPVMSNSNYPFPKWVQAAMYEKGESQSYTKPDGSIAQNAYNKWITSPSQIDYNVDPKTVEDSLDAIQSYKVNPDEIKKAVTAIYNDPKVQALLPKAKQMAQTVQTIPQLYKEVLSSIG